MNKDLDYYMNANYKIEIARDIDEGGYVFSCPELKGCITCADTLEQGIEMIEDAKESWFAACIEDGVLIPEPTSETEFSSQFKLHIPKSLQKTLIERSQEEGVTVNQYCLYLLSGGAGLREIVR